MVTYDNANNSLLFPTLSILEQTLKGMLVNTALIKNLTNADYMKILFKGKSSLKERFANIDIKLL